MVLPDDAEEDGGIAVKKLRFKKLAGIREHDWAGKYWLRRPSHGCEVSGG